MRSAGAVPGRPLASSSEAGPMRIRMIIFGPPVAFSGLQLFFPRSGAQPVGASGFLDL